MKTKIKESEERFRLMADASPVMIWMTNKNNQLEYMNRTKLDFLGKELNDISHEEWLETRHPEDREKFLKELLNAAKEKRGFSTEIRVKNKDGEYRWLIDSAAPRFLDDGTFVGLIGSGIDITERKKAEKIINESEKRFRRMTDASPVMIWMTNKNNQLEYMNRTKLDFLGIELDDISHEEWLETRHPDDRDKFLKELLNAAKEKRGFSTEIRVKNKDGEYRWLIDSAAPRFLDDGTFIGLIGSGIDITENKTIRISFQKSLKEKEILLKEIHHRVKNNLQVVSSLLSLQKNYITDPSVLDIFTSSQRRIGAMAILHEKLYGTENLANIDFHEYIKSITRSLLETYKNPGCDIRLNLNVEKIILDIDTSVSMGLIINELISNSLKYAFKGKQSGEISISMNYLSEDKNKLVFQLTDDGIGLPEDFNINEVNSLGLILVSSMAEKLGGKLIISNNGRTEFKIIFSQNEKESAPL